MSDVVVSCQAWRAPDRDVLELRVVRYVPDDARSREWLDPERGWVVVPEGEPIGPTVTFSGVQLSKDKPLDVALRTLEQGNRQVIAAVELITEAAVMRALAGRPAWFGIHETSDGRLLIDVTERERL